MGDVETETETADGSPYFSLRHDSVKGESMPFRAWSHEACRSGRAKML